MIEIQVECSNTKKSYISEELQEELNIDVEEELEWRNGYVFIDEISMIYESHDRENTLIEKKGVDGFIKVKENLEIVVNKIKNAKQKRDGNK